MGMDLLDIKFNLEREFDIRIDDECIHDLIMNGNTASPPKGAITDFMVSDLVRLVVSTHNKLNLQLPSDLTERVVAKISDSLSIPTEGIRVDSWLVADLGAE